MAGLVIALSISGATGSAAEPLALSRQARESTASPRVAPDPSGVSSHVRRGTQGQGGPSHRAANCPSARKAVRYYAGRIAYWRSRMGAPATHQPPRVGGCPRYLAKVLRAKSLAAKRAYLRWYEHEWHWQAWLPDKWQRIGACETGYGRRPGSFSWDSGTYVSFAGIYRAGYAQFAHSIGQLSWDETRSRLGRLPTPREQYEVALAIWRRYGFSGWGCRNA